MTLPDRRAARLPWTLLSNHGHVLVCIAEDPDARLREIADRVGITERSVFGIVTDLEEAGILRRERIGRRNRYTVFPDRPLRHPVEARHTVGELLRVLATVATGAAGDAATAMTAGAGRTGASGDTTAVQVAGADARNV
jgi:hypothetical protein